MVPARVKSSISFRFASFMSYDISDNKIFQFLAIQFVVYRNLVNMRESKTKLGLASK